MCDQRGTHSVTVNYPPPPTHTHTRARTHTPARAHTPLSNKYKSSYFLIVIPKHTFLKVFTSFVKNIHFFWKIWCTLLLHKFLLAFYEISISPCTCTCALVFFLFIIVIIISHRVLAIQACSIWMSVGLSVHCWCMLLLYVPNTSHYLHNFFFLKQWSFWEYCGLNWAFWMTNMGKWHFKEQFIQNNNTLLIWVNFGTRRSEK